MNRTRYAREWARRRQAKKLAARMVGALKCPKQFGRFVCGGPLRSGVDGIGRTVTVCEWCERKAKGMCRECSQPVTGRNIRCEAHKRAAHLRAFRKYRAANREDLNAKVRAYYTDSDERRESRNQYKRLWRKANPDLVKAQKRRYALRQKPAVKKYSTKYHATVAPARAALRLAREVVEGPQPRTCLTVGCAVVVSGRRKKCEPCKQREREQAARSLRRAA